jgi:hypothetical protein
MERSFYDGPPAHRLATKNPPEGILPKGAGTLNTSQRFLNTNVSGREPGPNHYEVVLAFRDAGSTQNTSSMAARRISATLQAWATQPRGILPGHLGFESVGGMGFDKSKVLRPPLSARWLAQELDKVRGSTTKVAHRHQRRMITGFCRLALQTGIESPILLALDN